MRRSPNIFVALFLFIAGTVLVFYVLRANGWHSGIDPIQVRQYLAMGPRAAAMAGFIASAYGLGAIINNLVAKNRA